MHVRPWRAYFARLVRLRCISERERVRLGLVCLWLRTLANIYFARRSHKLDEWHTYCDWALELPYFKTLIADTKD